MERCEIIDLSLLFFQILKKGLGEIRPLPNIFKIKAISRTTVFTTAYFDFSFQLFNV
ncbi:hypothetical protein SAMN05444396_102270 [Flavobacterium segetis]|uniref:Uncharacterized protein n=1 Tax=Flavobacterium segetis TaxID=271157 RepID=A0A1M5FBU5_9FLAO|nr:hypothetical protein SAMN05444396_102270 [Flavobacterium segetis]